LSLRFSNRTLLLFTLVLLTFQLPVASFAGDAASQPADEVPPAADFNNAIYYKNKLEFAFDTGWFPYNTPFVFNPLMGDKWDRPPLDYTLVPLIISLRWHLDDLGGPWMLRGNTDITFSGSYTLIPQGPESRYTAFMMGVRYNFVQPNSRLAPYIEGRGGLGVIDAKGPAGVQWAQGQDFTYTFTLGSGVRYNFNPRFGVSAGIAYTHISNLYLSEPKHNNYGINVFGPTLGVNFGL
jgi:hypothetical protein